MHHLLILPVNKFLGVILSLGPDKFDYLNAAYATIVTFGTIGYGDIYPIKFVNDYYSIFFYVRLVDSYQLLFAFSI